MRSLFLFFSLLFFSPTALSAKVSKFRILFSPYGGGTYFQGDVLTNSFSTPSYLGGAEVSFQFDGVWELGAQGDFRSFSKKSGSTADKSSLLLGSGFLRVQTGVTPALFFEVNVSQVIDGPSSLHESSLGYGAALGFTSTIVPGYLEFKPKIQAKTLTPNVTLFDAILMFSFTY